MIKPALFRRWHQGTKPIAVQGLPTHFGDLDLTIQPNASGEELTYTFKMTPKGDQDQQVLEKIVLYPRTAGGRAIRTASVDAKNVDSFTDQAVVIPKPLMMLQPDGHLTSCDLLHTVAAAIIFDVYENQDSRLAALQIPDRVIRTFPGPAHGPQGIRKLTHWPANEPAFGTILKPTAGITPREVGDRVEQIAQCPLFLFVKEDEDLYPNLDYSPVAERTRRAMAAIAKREGRGLIFAPHISGAPHELLDTVNAVLDAGATGVMFSESFAGGAVRMIREATKRRAQPPVIYGHNAGIGVKTRAIWREVIDLLARLDGIDFRQTSVVQAGPPFLLPYGAEWRAAEEILTRPLPGIAPTMITRAGGLDQGNIGLNLADTEQRGLGSGVLFLAGSAINSIKNAAGNYDTALGAEAMQQAIDVHRSGELRGVSVAEHLRALIAVAERNTLTALREALRQRYPKEAA